MNWARLDLAWLLVLLPVVLVATVWSWRRRSALLIALRPMLPPGVDRARGWQAVLLPLSLALLIAAALGPRLGFEWVQRKVEGVAIVVVLDVSRSMDAEDVSPSRMERARRELADLVAVLRGDAVGLVLVANGAFIRMPLTIDYDTFLWGLDDTSTATITAQGTAMAGGIEAAVKALGSAAGSGRAILVVSDGEFHDDDAALVAATATARAAEIPIYALGIGESGGAPIPLAEGGFKKDSSGQVVMSKLDEDRLRALAAATGGAYVRAVVGDDDVRGLYEGQLRARLEAAERGVRREKVWFERFQWPLAVGFFLLVAHALVGIGPRARVARRAAPALLLLGLATWPTLAQAGAREDGLKAYSSEDWAAAVEALGRARVADPRDTTVGQALAESLYRAGRFRESEQVYDALAANDAAGRATHLYNAGHAAYRGGRLDEAAQRFAAAAEADPKLEAATRNADVVRREIALREQQQPPEREPTEGEQDQGEGQEGEAGNEGQSGEQAGSGASSQAEGERTQPQQAPSPGEEQGEGEQQAFTPGGEAGDETEAPGSAVEAPTGEGEMDRASAARLVDGVKDGRPHVQMSGGQTEKDW